ncbi:P-selectin glycoprotein ligand 1 [Phoca vitulina]|uniref:P-selectin glycoprotein ligand 1 n=1 Tax=Phoca vitulina TaxID=9720 RepID=UPI0013962BC7|nr:P-selectin glycoprotein ligand 1 [Phoca vitulina]XP_032253917.1 P-selectin glycoprotein ligand 1 [Phoca vitulina]XP_032253918.1 P-selectin glycoprotein ligand 1 [Phoca vitulina]XP_032253919.1 P-selectin glycoprotein ligand 1 [Phoca vitulina]XP_032253920.1 P-selectin glycoprotein ligand 1 [Phoca vitulina]
MPLQVLLLLILLGPGSSLQLWELEKDGAQEAPDTPLARGRRQVDEDHEVDSYDYVTEGTEPPEMLIHEPGSLALTPNILSELATLGHGTPEPATLEVATRDSAGLDTGGVALGNLSMEVATQVIPVTPDTLTKEPATTLPPITEAQSTEGAPSTELATTEAPSTEPAATEAPTTQPVATEAPSMESTVMETLSTGPEATDALSTEPTATEALPMESTVMETLSTGPEATDALSTEPTATEALSMESTVMEILSTEPEATDALSTEPTATEALSTDPATTKVPSTGPATIGRLATVLLVTSDPQNSTTVAGGNLLDVLTKRWENRQHLSPQSSVAPIPTGALDRIPVKQCLLAIFILALVATTFLVCTVVLAVRLSRKNHMYPVRNYSPTEMVCISSLLPEGGEVPTATANGGLPNAKSQGLKAEPGEGRDGDDLTLQSFLP